MLEQNKPISNKAGYWIIGLISIIVVGVVGFLIFYAYDVEQTHENIYFFPKLNAFINSSVTLLLITGFIFIRKKMITAHRSCMISALVLSALFLVSYIFYHSNAPHTSFGGEGMIRNVYFFILITHIILAIFIVPLALLTIFRILNLQVEKHKKIARWTLPIWLYVSITGVLVYLMISPYYPV